jgi:hypothetical protein
MKIQITSVILILLIISSCAKTHVAKIHIKARNPVTNEAIPNAIYSVFLNKTSKLFKTKSIQISSGILNENGEIYLNIELKTKESYSIVVNEPENTCKNKYSSFKYQSDKVDYEFEFTPCGFIRYNLMNANCEGTNDILVFDYSYNENYGKYGVIPLLHGGCSTVQSEFKAIPMGQKSFGWNAQRTSGTTSGGEYVYLHAGEYLTYNLSY